MFSASLAQFPIREDSAEQNKGGQGAEEIEEEKSKPRDKEREGYLEHPVSSNETLVGIALKYRTTVRAC